MLTITPFLWFDGDALETAQHCVSLFSNSQIKEVLRYGEAGRELHGQAAGTVMTVVLELDGQRCPIP